MHILVTGSSGTIGTRLCEKLLERGDEVTGIDWEPNKWQKNVEAITQHIDMRDEKALEKFNPSKKIDAIIHLAANARVYELVEHPERAKDNVTTVFNALELARRLEIPRFFFASSREVYGNSQAEKYSEEMVHVEHCESPYTASKIAGEALVEAYTRCYDMSHIIFRFSNVYGMYDDSIRVVPLFIRQAKKNEPMKVFGKDKCLDFTYIDDTIDGIMLAIDKFDAAKNTTINLAYGEGVTILSLAEQAKALLGSSSTIELGIPRTGEVVRYIADISKAKKLLGFAPKTPFAEGIQKSVEWYSKNT